MSSSDTDTSSFEENITKYDYKDSDLDNSMPKELNEILNKISNPTIKTKIKKQNGGLTKNKYVHDFSFKKNWVINRSKLLFSKFKK